MKITIEIPDESYVEYFDEDDNLIVQEPPFGDMATMPNPNRLVRKSAMTYFFDRARQAI